MRLAVAVALASFLAACGSSVSVPDDGGGGDGPGPTSDAATTGAGGEGGSPPEEEPLVAAPGGMRRLQPEQLLRSVEVLLGQPAAQAIESLPAVPQLHGFAAIGAANPCS